MSAESRAAFRKRRTKRYPTIVQGPKPKRLSRDKIDELKVVPQRVELKPKPRPKPVPGERFYFSWRTWDRKAVPIHMRPRQQTPTSPKVANQRADKYGQRIHRLRLGGKKGVPLHD